VLKGPDLFLVGAPKCGTTAMADYLDQHPEIAMCPYKELHFFGTDLQSRAPVKRDQWRPTRDEYMRTFEDLQRERRRGEASGWYLYSSAAPREIHDFCPGAEIVAMLRNPLTMLPSLHSQLVYWGIEPVEDFEQALALDEERERTGTPEGFVPDSYRSAVRYGGQLRRYLDVFGPEQVHVIIFDRFSDDTGGVFRETCEFLGVDPSFVPSIEVVNPNKMVRSRTTRRLLRRPPEPLRRALHAVTSRETRRRGGMILRRWNTRYVPRPPASAAVNESLRALVADEVRELKELVGIDVSFWLD
jgi:Sulfotransferase domain